MNPAAEPDPGSVAGSAEGAAANAPAQALALALARQVRDWSLAQGAEAEAAAAAAQAARAVSLAGSDGHVCVRIDALGLSRETLRASRVVGTDDAPGALPLVLDSGGRLYTQRAFEHERALAARVRSSFETAAPARTRPPPAADEQAAAVEHALAHRLTLISGGPGSGKTTTVARLLARVLARDPDARIALAAPTGKAAARMSESLLQRAGSGAATAGEHPLDGVLPERLAQPASTVHRLLRWRPHRRTHGGFTHHAGQPLALDWLVVDEASMLDLALARRLLDAVPLQAHVVLLGDAHQLAAVEAGAVFAELTALRTPPLAVHLTRSHRFGETSAIGRFARHVLQGDADAALALLAAGGDELGWWPGEALDLAPIEAAWRPYVDVVASHAAGASTTVHAALSRCRVLAASRHGPRGVQRLNQHLDAWMRQRLGAAPAAEWYAGRPVLVTQNQPELGVFNGDVGVALPGGDIEAGASLIVHIADRPGLAPMAPARLTALESAYAMTVHKAQGSEADEVLLVLPAPPSPLLTRELLYTAVTRARRRVSVFASAEALRAAITTPTQRASGLAARLAA